MKKFSFRIGKLTGFFFKGKWENLLREVLINFVTKLFTTCPKLYPERNEYIAKE